MKKAKRVSLKFLETLIFFVKVLKSACPTKTPVFYQKELINDLQWLLDISSKHASVDTFARKLSIIGDSKNLKKLKVVLSVFFTFEQIIKQPDERYDSFFASLYNENGELPENIRILSWNYDSKTKQDF